MSKPECFGGYLSGNIAAERDCGRCFWDGACCAETGLRRLKPGPLSVERDPAGLPPHAPGAKLDGEKVMAELTLDGFSRALLAVAEVSTYGAKKYSPGGWQHVDDGQTRYRRAGDRHRLFRGHEQLDPAYGPLTLSHEAWNRLAELELMLRERSAKVTSPAGRHTGAPDAAPEQAATEENRAAGKPEGDTSWVVWRYERPNDPNYQYQVFASTPDEAIAAYEVYRGAPVNRREYGVCPADTWYRVRREVHRAE